MLARDDLPWAIVQLNQQNFGISTQFLRELTVMPAIVPMPATPDYVRGLINLRGDVLPLLDLRRRLGFKALAQETREFHDLLAAREQDHRRWLDEL